MDITYFNTEIGYYGQDIHIARNDQEFDLFNLISNLSSGQSVSYIFESPFSSVINIASFDNVSINIQGNSAKIKASQTTL